MNNRLKSGFGFYLILLIVLCLGVYFYYLNSQNTTDEYTVNQFEQDLKAGDVTKIVIKQNEEVPTGVVDASIRGKGTKQFYVSDVTSVVDHVTSDYSDVEVHMTDVDRPSIWVSILPYILMTVVFVFVFFMMTAGAGGGGGGNSRMMNFSKSKAKVIRAEDMDVDFTKVAGLQEEKEEVREIVDFLKEPQRFMDAGARIPKGVIMVGPPGTGKTLLAKAIAGEAKVPFFSISGSDFVEMFVGVGAARVRDLFEEAKKNAPCIIFIDEIDAIGKRRDSGLGGGNDEREQTLNQLLSEMDGFDTSKGLLILAATNRPEVLDQALLRPGRFDRRVIVDKPDLKGRVNILKVHSKDVHLDETVDLEAIALATSGAVGSDLANMINEAAILAVKAGRNMVSQKDLFEAVEVVLVGKEKKDRILSKEERRIVSYHEVGHALVSALQKDSEPVQKITIVPRTMGALGYVMNVPEEEKYLNTEKEIRAMLVEFVAGRAAEEIVFDTVTTGAANDIEKATRIARAMVTQYGMSPKFGLIGLETVESQYLSGRTVLNCSDEMAAEVDREVMQILKDSYAEAKRLLTENREALDKIAAFLIEKETITGKEFMEIFHQVRGDQPESTEGEKSRISEKQIGLPEAAESVKTEEPAAAGEEKTAETDAARAEIAEGAEAEQPAAKAETEDVE